MFSDFLSGLVTQLRTVTDPHPLNVLNHEPTSAQKSPAAYITLLSFERTARAQMITVNYTIRVRACVAWQDNEQSTLILADYINTIPAAIEADPHLAGDTTKTLVVSGSLGWVPIASTTYYVCDIIVNGFEQGAIGTL